MKFLCQHCGKENEVHVSGRKHIDVNVTMIYDALRSGKSYRAAAEIINRKTGMGISGALVHKRVTMEADRQGISRKALVARIMGNRE